MNIAIIRETKIPPDFRVVMSPEQCLQLRAQGVDIVVQSSPNRIFSDDEYSSLGVTVVEDVSDYDVLLGVKEVEIDQLLPEKTYFFFSHTIKKQPYNRGLLQKVMSLQSRLIDYEVLTDENNKRLIAFGYFAGIVGAYNAVWGYGRRHQLFDLPRLYQCHDYNQATREFEKIKLPPIKIVLTGSGRVSTGAAQVLDDMKIARVSPLDFLTREFDYPVYTQLSPLEYARHKEKSSFEVDEFYEHPDRFDSQFSPYTQHSNIMINGIYWDNSAPVFFTKEDMKNDDFKIELIADITCDIAPVASIPSTLRATTIKDPYFRYDPLAEKENPAFTGEGIDMMTIDNLPNEVPRDASQSFGEQFIREILPSLLEGYDSDVISRGTITADGKLTPRFAYLQDYVDDNS